MTSQAKEFHYNSDLVGGSLMVRESRAVADLLLCEVSKEEWDKAVLSDNLLQKRSPASSRRNAQAIRKRLEKLPREFWRALRDGDDELATQVSLCAALERNLLLVEFIERVVKDAYLTHAGELELYAWFDFLDECGYRDAEVAGWTESTRKKMGQVVFRILAEAGYLENTRTRRLQRVVVRPEVKVMLQDNYKHRLLACLEVSSGGAG